MVLYLVKFPAAFAVILVGNKSELGPPAHAAPPFWPPLLEGVAVIFAVEASNPHHYSSWPPKEYHNLLDSSSMASTILLGGLPMGASLADLGYEALSLFQRVETVDSDKTPQDWPTASFTAEAERFELWAVNLGLFVTGHGSLDYRVREADRLAQTIRRFLQELMDSLVEGEIILVRTRMLHR